MNGGSSRVAADILRVLPRKRISSAMGRLADVGGPSPLVGFAIDTFCKAYDVNLDEAVVPPGGFDSFDAFFTRTLKPGARTIDPRVETVVSPADGKVEDLGEIHDESTFLVKGREYEVGELLGDPESVDRYRGGAFFIVYLAPRDYHRVHAPVAGRVQWARHVPGTLWPVNTIGLSHVPRLFARNERVVTSQACTGHGAVCTVMVGAIGVGRITMAYDPRIVTNSGREAGVIRYGEGGPFLERGGELGTFHMGSTAVVLLPPRPEGDRYRFLVEPGAKVKMGQALVTGEATA